MGREVKCVCDRCNTVVYAKRLNSGTPHAQAHFRVLQEVKLKADDGSILWNKECSDIVLCEGCWEGFKKYMKEEKDTCTP